MTAYIPYCGSPPVPGELMGAWNLDPWLLAGLGAAMLGYGLGAARARDVGALRAGAFAVGWLLVAACLVSPLCNLTVALFSARVAQHMLLTLVAAPLVVLGRPERAFAALLGGVRIGRLPGLAWVGPAAFAVLLWFWHLPVPYDATLRSDGAYWAMHLSLFGAALLLWRVLLPDGAAPALVAVGAGFLTSLQMGLLGAFLTLAGGAWYESHEATSWPWGLSPLADQQLGGLIMWVPGCAVFLVAGLAGVASLLSRLERRGDPVQSRP
ncbi:cytochrome c oxidase assembly protein [Arenibaculum sp.]|jgi:putative membrane protein|uniref:cytochrome c oxidase assembly protein n=1 Tax=Arenibaculum sp. TaxID=2865862 RepID=UPI002E167279|nr:cytochrome c oxidase assembly protein [Arenibaculum sp.]